MNYAAFVNGNKTMLIAPAGYGKTYTIAECLKYTTGRQLILTHTHAGIASIKEKIKTAGIESKKYHIETICGFAQKYTTAFYTDNNLPPQEDKKYFPFLIDKACDYFCIEQVKKIIRISYAGLFVDEYQDCSKGQHKMIMELSKVLPTHILGDPMQGIFDFNGDLVDFNSDLNDFEISRLDIPYRWYNNDRSNLGDALKSMRESLEVGKCINLNDFKNIAGLHWLAVDQENKKDIFDTKTMYRKWIERLLDNPQKNKELDSLLFLVPNISARSNIHARVKLRNQIDYAKKLVLIEAMDEKDLYTVATTIDNIISAPGLQLLKDDILSFIFNISDINKWFNEKGLKRKTNPNDKKTSDKLKIVLDTFILNPAPSTMLIMLKILKTDFKFKYSREELFYGTIKALEVATSEKISVYEGMKRHRNIIRRVGRRVTGKCLGTTLLTKGLEFDTVAILDAHEFDSPTHLYVALTRCCKRLVIFTKTMQLNPYKN